MKTANVLAAAIVAAAALPSLPARAADYLLDFGRSAAEPLNACTTASGVCSTFAKLKQSYGDVPGVVDVSTRAHDGGALSWWNGNYNDLYGVLFNPYYSNVSPAWVDLVLAPEAVAAGHVVTLTRFDLGGYLGRRRDVAVSVIDLADGGVLYSRVGDIGSVGTGVGGNWGMHTGFDLNLRSAAGLRIQWDDPAVAGNTAIDNIAFSVGVAQPVPEPASGGLLLAGLAGVAWLARRRLPAAPPLSA